MEVEGDAHEGCPCKAFTALRKSPPERETVKKVSWWKRRRRYFRTVTVCLFSSLVASPLSHTSLSANRSSNGFLRRIRLAGTSYLHSPPCFRFPSVHRLITCCLRLFAYFHLATLWLHGRFMSHVIRCASWIDSIHRIKMWARIRLQ